MFGQHRPASETPFKWRFAGGTMMARLKRYKDPLSLLQKKVVKVGSPLQNFLGPIIHRLVRAFFVRMQQNQVFLRRCPLYTYSAILIAN